MEQGEPETKKFKHSIFSDDMYEPEYQQSFLTNWQNRTYFETPNIELFGEPFRICKVTNFLKSLDFMDKLKGELADVPLRRNTTDLFQFEQSNDLVSVNSPTIKLFYETFQRDLGDWFEKFTQIKLNKKISMSTSCYAESDYLLCHDDCLGDRKIAYILYLSENWEHEDGGMLDLFDTDEYGRPKSVVRSLLPEYNSLIFFEVVDNSFHQVSEIMAVRKTRWSVNGWFHGPVQSSNRIIRPDRIQNFVDPDYSEVDLSLWISKVYLYPGIVREIQEDVEQESFAFLSDFLKPEVYEEICKELKSDCIRWNVVGPADIRKYEVAEEESLPTLLTDFFKVFRSISLFQLLKNYTELDLVPENDTMTPKMTIEIQRWTRGSYTLVSDKDNYQSEPESDGASGSGEVQASCSSENHDMNSSPVRNHRENESEISNGIKIDNGTEIANGAGIDNEAAIATAAQAQDGAEIEIGTEVEIEADSTENGKKSSINMSKSDAYEIAGHCSTSTSTVNSRKHYYQELNSNKIDSNLDCNTPPSSQGEDDEDEDNGKVRQRNKDTSESDKVDYPRDSLLKAHNACSVKNRRDTDTDDSDVSDIGDYLSDPLDGEHSGQDDAEDQGASVDDDLDDEQDNIDEPGVLDVIMQFNTRGIIENETIDYVDIKENNGTLIHVPSKDNHLCLVYRTLGICRVHKYINYSCKGYFYNLVCTYCE